MAGRVRAELKGMGNLQYLLHCADLEEVDIL